MKYLVIDFYEGREILYCGTDCAKARRIEKQRIKDTDGECDTRFYDSFHQYAMFRKLKISID